MIEEPGNVLLHPWGKARPAPGAVFSWHPLMYHCLDVAAIGEALLRQRPEIPVRLAARLGWRDDVSGRLIAFLLSLHDVGKLSRPFQAKVPELWPAAVLGPVPTSPPRDPGHPVTGAFLLAERGDELAPLLPRWPRTSIDDLLAPFTGHHGRPVARSDHLTMEIVDSACLGAARALVETMRALFQPDPIGRPEPQPLRTASWQLAGLAVLADWIGSRQAWFPYTPPERSPAAYLDDLARPRAAAALHAAGIGPARASTATGYRALTGESYPPSPAQAWAEMVELPAGPFVAVIEDVTGSGKTEAALILAHRLLAAGRARGLYLALPTMATANAMYERLAATYRRLFAAGETPSLALAHGRSRLHAGFQESLAGLAEPGRAREREEEAEADASGAACAAWLADDRRKAFLADVGVGTIDQAILAVLPATYQSLRLLGLGERVLIVDEAHAYDAYMGRELERLLQFQAAQGGCAVVLSATLPRAVRGKLAAAFAEGLGGSMPALRADDYPLVTVADAGGAREAVMAPRADLRRGFAVERLAPDGAALARIVEAARAGAAVAWVRNTVDDAIGAVEQLRAAGTEADLFHARFAMGDRLSIERAVVRRFGRPGDPAARPGVLVATQVIEQSLDLDFDLVVSDLAPVDLLLQRAGRLWRHPERPRPVPDPRLLVVSPEPSDGAEADWYAAAFPGAAWVYRNHALLWLSARALFGRSQVRVPEDVRGLVEAVYGGEDEGRYPPALERNWTEAEGEARAARSIAESNLLKVERGYAGAHPGWDEDTRTPTRLGEEMVTLRLARLDYGRLVPWCPDPDRHRAWALSEVAVRRTRMAGVLEPAPAFRAAAAAARAEWTRHDADKLLLPLFDRGDDSWYGCVTGNGRGRLVAIYTRGEGLSFG